MKKVIIMINLFCLASCTKDTCAEQIAKATEHYQNTISVAGGSSQASVELLRQYNAQVAEINRTCK